MATEREKFESWFLKDNPKRNVIWWSGMDRYSSEFAQIAWEAWQAGRVDSQEGK
jgi:hypothetical protein